MKTIHLGQWPQGSGGEVRPIEWYVLHEDPDRILMHCVCGLWSMAFDVTGRKVFWATSSIRAWLEELYRQGFSDGERKHILEVRVDNLRGLRQVCPERYQTMERLFLLSEEEICGMAFEASAWIRKPSVWAAENGAYADGNGNGVWWLRSYGRLEHLSMSVVRPDGVIYPSGDVRAENVLICPALWIRR